MTEATLIAKQGIERVFTGMPQGRMTDVMPHRKGLDEIFVERQPAGHRPGDARDLKRVGQSAAMVVAVVASKHLRLVGQPAKGRRMHDPVAIPLVGAAMRMHRLRMHPAGRLRRMHRPRSQQRGLPLTPFKHRPLPLGRVPHEAVPRDC